MEKEFSREFQQGLADILEMCMENKTDNCIMTLDCGDVELTMKIVFSAKKKEPEARV
jgi:hypothetical protein